MDGLNIDDLIAFVLVGFALTGSPGPATLGLAATGAAYGFRSGFRFLMGLMAGILIVISSVAAGVFATILAIPSAAIILSIIAVVYFGYLAFKIATAPPIGEQSAQVDAPGFLAGLVLNLSNPKAYAAFAALFSGFQLFPATPAFSTVFQVMLCFCIVSIVNPLWLLTGSALRRMLHNPETSRRVNHVFAAVLVLSVVLTLLV